MSGIKVIELKDRLGRVKYSLENSWNFFSAQKNPYILYLGWTGKMFGFEESEFEKKELIMKKKIYNTLLWSNNPILKILSNSEIGNFGGNIEGSFFEGDSYKLGISNGIKEMSIKEFNNFMRNESNKFNVDKPYVFNSN